jgi:translation initiation factor IF-2
MNNGKVRIYELSKELNLDNRDVLAICEQLNIAFKSHSSTITDTDADRIRAAAEKYAASHPASTKPPARQAHSPSVDSRKKPPLNIQKKQQILEIRRPITQRSGATNETQAPELRTPPVAPTAQPPRLNAPNSPSANSPNNSTNPSVNSTPDPVTEPPRPAQPMDVSLPEVPEELKLPQPESPEVEAAAPVEPKKQPPAPAAQKPESVVESKKPEPVVVEKPLEVQAPVAKPPVNQTPSQSSQPLVQPPPRPAAPSAKSNLTSKPILKRDRTPDNAPAQPEGREKPQKADGNKPQRPAINKRPGPNKPGDANKPQQIVELRRPKPVQPSAEGQDAAVGAPVLKANRPNKPAESATQDVAAVQLQLNRPTPPKPKRGGKGWEEEEEENLELEKAKAANKGKRRTQPRIEEDDEDDLDGISDEDEDTVSAEQVSLSLARPAKPKSLPGQQPRPAAVATPTQRKKPSQTFRDRRDRRDQQNKVERPEVINVTGGLTVQELANVMMVAPTEIITKLFMKGIAATITQTLDLETIEMVAEEYGVLVDTDSQEAAAKKVTEMIDAADLDHLVRRPPVVTIMGHVDHGKTTLLDSIRKTKVAAGEAGGITQHIGAYHVDVEHNGEMQQVVFLDTPGHEAFTAMRARGARVTDVAILVVAADDGVQPQTIEAISHAKAAEVPIIIAINKIDKEGAQPDRVKQELTEYNLVPEEWGGDTIMVPVSAMAGTNLDTLLEMILLVTEVEDLTANPDRTAKGTVIEAHLDKAKGPTATLLVQNGTLRVGDVLVAGSALGKVRAMMDDRGRRVQAALPSFAVELLGLSDVPAAGDEFEVFLDEKQARAIASERLEEQRNSRLAAAQSSRRVSLNNFSSKAKEGELKELNLVLKADVQGSVEAIIGSLRQLPQNEVQVRVLFSAPGEISETDIDLAAASDAVVIGFNTTLAPGARQAADRAGVDVRDYNIIYKLLDDVQAAMEGLLEPEMVEEPLGQVEVRAVFPVGRGAVAGCYVQSGKITRNCKIRVHRGNQVIHEGNLDSLKRMREDVREVNSGYECGIGLDDFNDWKEGDIIEAFKMVSKRRTLTPAR